MTTKRLLALVVLVVVVFAGLVGYGDFKEIGAQLSSFPISHLFAALGLAAVNYGLRFIRWAYYLRRLNIAVPFGMNILVFLSGLAMSITPGKAGELLKSYLLRDRIGLPVSASAPVVVMERLTDVVSVVLLALLGMALLPVPVLAILAGVLGISAGLLLLIVTKRGDWIFDMPLLRRWGGSLRTSYAGLQQLAAPQTLVVSIILGVGAWLSEGLALWVILKGLDAEVSLIRALPIYAAATLVGAVSALPGGLVGTEGSMVALLQQSGVARGAASAGTLLVRLATLWFAVVVGLIAFFCLNRFFPAFKNPDSELDGERESPALQTPS